MIKITLVTAYAVVSFLAIAALQHGVIRQVNAEDDCAFNTYAVERIPGLGLFCIGEPS